MSPRQRPGPAGELAGDGDVDSEIPLEVILRTAKLTRAERGLVLACSALRERYRELELKTIFPILTRPLRRWEYLVGKYLGTVLTLAVLVMAVVGFLSTVVLSRLIDRLPIGGKTSLETFKTAAVRRFYADWYRPDLMAVIAVGDFDGVDSRVQAALAPTFAGARTPAADPASTS